MIITIKEIIDLLIMSIILGIIFSDLLKQRLHYAYYPSFNIKNILIASLIVSPGIVLHELFHKFFAMFFGASATFEVSFFGLMLGLILKLLRFPFIIFVPGYVRIVGRLSHFESAIVAFAGPFANLLLYFLFNYLYKKERNIIKAKIFFFSSKINLFLFFFNLIPLPPFDGFQVISNIILGIISLF